MFLFVVRDKFIFFDNKTQQVKIVCLEANCGKDPDMKMHVNSHRGNYKFSCDICGKGFMSRNHYHTHCNSHSDRRDFKCGNCE